MARRNNREIKAMLKAAFISKCVENGKLTK
jgi:hypothetical protein